MSGALLVEADALYQVATECVITSETVSFEPVHTFTTASRSFARSLEDLGTDVWRAFLLKLTRSGWDLLNAPLPLSSPLLNLADVAKELRTLAGANLNLSDAAIVANAQDVADILQGLGQRRDDPLGERCCEILATGNLSRSGLLVRETLWRDAVCEAWQSNRRGAAIFVPAALRQSPLLETLVVVGQARFYPESVFSAPRAESIGIVRYSWLFDIDEVQPLLPGPGNFPIRIRRFNLASEPAEDGYFEPRIDWEAILQRAGLTFDDNGTLADQDIEQARAHLFLIAGNFGVYLEAEDGPSVLVIDPDADDEERVRRTPTQALEQGDFILLRKERSESDFLEEVANQLLGADMSILRAAQARWKQRLREVVRSQGVTSVARGLEIMGASVQNLRYWMSPDSLRTRRPQDFEILMEFLGLGDQAGEVWAQMGRIDEAHQRAGFRIRTKLLELVRTADLGRLTAEGTVDFELPDEDAGTLSISRIEAKSPSVTVVHRHRLRVPFPVEREPWLG